jgi:CMP-N-acetylneuraminic acid synthetase
MTIAVIAARGGSRRLPRKNVYPFFGEPMITWSIAACKEAEEIGLVVVTSDDLEILAIAQQMDCQTVLRPAELALDEVPRIEPVRHAVNLVEAEDGVVCDVVAVVSCNSPETRAAELDAAIRKLRDKGLWEVVSLDRDLINNGAFRIIRRACLDNTFSAHSGAVISDAIDIHTIEDLKAAEARYPSAAAFRESRR